MTYMTYMTYYLSLLPLFTGLSRTVVGIIGRAESLTEQRA